MSNDDSSATSTQISRLLAEHDCRQLVLEAAALNDAGEYERFVELFTPDGQLCRPGGAVLRGREAIAASYKGRAVGDRIAKHMILGSLFSDVSTDKATAASQVLLWTASAEDSEGPFGRPARHRQIAGTFVDQFLRTDAGWRIARRDARFDIFHELS
jgi:hypothetical protein